MTITLIYPPSADPTAPYISLPLLAGWLRGHGHAVCLVDANLEGWLRLLRPGPLEAMARQVEQRLGRLDRRPRLSHAEQLCYLQLVSALGDGTWAPRHIDEALALFRGGQGDAFFDETRYSQAVATVEAAQRLISAAYAPLELTFAACRSPFSLLTIEEIKKDSQASRNPFHEGFDALARRLVAMSPDLVGLSVAFPAQVQPALALASVLRARLPEVLLCGGGPAFSQIALRLDEAHAQRLFSALDVLVVGEGEQALLDLCRDPAAARGPEAGISGCRIIRGQPLPRLDRLPAPDFEGLPLAQYLSPAPVLPYDASRGCYWGRCTFCHYGPVASGTAAYRPRPAAQIISDLKQIHANNTGCLFYLSHDSLAPGLARRLSEGLAGHKPPLRWASDMRPDRRLTPELAVTMARGGALALSLGVESGCPRTLARMDKGLTVAEAEASVRALASAGLAAEVMLFTGYPGETPDEAQATLKLLERLDGQASLFMCGEFGLTHGSRLALRPADHGLLEVYTMQGDELQSTLFFTVEDPPVRPDAQHRLEERLDAVARGYRLRPYPFAGSLQTAHTLLYYQRFGPGALRRPRTHDRSARGLGPTQVLHLRFDPIAIARSARPRDAAIWHTLVEVDRRVSRSAYQALAARAPAAFPHPVAIRVRSGAPPEPASTPRKRKPPRR